MERPIRAAHAALLTSLVLACAPPPAPPAWPDRPPRDEDPVVAPVEPAALGTLHIGVLLPRSASPALRQYGELVLEGARLAVREFEETTGRSVELRVHDDEGNPFAAAQLVRRLEAEGALGIIGPLLSDVFAEAAAARSQPGLVLVSPTAADLPAAQNVYSLGVVDPAGPRALADYAVSVGLERLAVLHPRVSDYAAKASVFIDALAEAGGWVTLAMPYDSGTTTFAAHLQAIALAEPDAIYIPAPTRDVQQIAPQLAYYGLRSRALQIFGDEGWVEDETRRRVPMEFLEGTIASTRFYSAATELRWNEFVQLFESSYRRSLDNLFPGYGYDAAWLLLDAAAEASTPDEVAARVGARPIRGATAVLEMREGRLVRRPFLVQWNGGSVRAAPDPRAYVLPAPLYPPADTVDVDEVQGTEPRRR